MGHTSSRRQLTPLEAAHAEVLFYERRRDELIAELGTNQTALEFADRRLVQLTKDAELERKATNPGENVAGFVGGVRT